MLSGASVTFSSQRRCQFQTGKAVRCLDKACANSSLPQMYLLGKNGLFFTKSRLVIQIKKYL